MSIIHKIFDPIAFTAPAILVPKLILEQTWKLKLKWDEENPEDLKRQLINWLNKIEFSKETHIPRWLNTIPAKRK